MKIIYYLFVVFFGFLGVGLILRAIEMILTKESSSTHPVISLCMGIILFAIGLRYLGKAREN